MTIPTAGDDQTTPTTPSADHPAEGAAHATGPAVEAAADSPTSAEESVTTTPGATSAALGQHVAPRPYPPVPPTSVRGVTAETDSLLPPMPSGTAGTPPPPPGTAPPLVGAPPAPAPVTTATVLTTDEAPTTLLDDHAPVPDLPRRPGARRHLVGALLGLLLTPVGLVPAAMGVGHMIDLRAGDGALTDVFGLVLLAAGALVLGLVAVLGRWSPAVPLTAGALWGLFGGSVALWDPQGVSDAVHQVTDGRFAQVAIDHILDPALNGSLLLLGLVLLGSGIAAGLARGAGRSFGARTVRAQAARAEAESRSGSPRSP